MSVHFYYAHGHPKEVCQLELTGARRTSRGKIFSYSINTTFCTKRHLISIKILEYIDKTMSKTVELKCIVVYGNDCQAK